MDHSFWLRYFLKCSSIGRLQTVDNYLLLPGGVKQDGENVSRSLRFGGGSYQGQILTIRKAMDHCISNGPRHSKCFQ